MNDYIIRKKQKKKFIYVDKKGNKLTKKQYEPYLHVYIPPGYDDVKINKRRGKVRAIGYDDKRRAQYIYDSKFTNKQSKSKFSKLIDFGKHYQKIHKKIETDLYTTRETKDKQIATILMLIIECDFRVGNDKYTRENKSYGVTTLESRHVRQKDGKLVVDFIGKKGVRNICQVQNKKVARNLKTKKKTVGKRGRLFSYQYKDSLSNVTSKDVNQYLKKMGNYSTKYFRTWSANISLIQELLDKQSLKDSIESTADKLHNTPTVCKKNYLDPKLIYFYEKHPKKFFDFFTGNLNDKYYKFLQSHY